jgi:hypothetical protein
MSVIPRGESIAMATTGRAKVLLSRIPNVLAVAKQVEPGTRCQAIPPRLARSVQPTPTWSPVCRRRLGGSVPLPEAHS